MDGPLERCHFGQNRRMPAGRKAGQESRKGRAIDDEMRLARWCAQNELMRRVGEEALIAEPGSYWEDRPQMGGERQEHVIAIDRIATCRIGVPRGEFAFNVGKATVDDGASHRCLECCKTTHGRAPSGWRSGSGDDRTRRPLPPSIGLAAGKAGLKAWRRPRSRPGDRPTWLRRATYRAGECPNPTL